jgi:hypothetical protein
MTTATVHTPSAFTERAGTFWDRLAADPAYQAFWLLRIGFTVAPIVFGSFSAWTSSRTRW